MIILGIMAFGLNPSACLLVDGVVVALVEEERLIRCKGAPERFPSESIKYCLKEASLTLDDVDVVAIGRDPRRYTAAVPSRYLSTWLRYPKNMRTARWELQQLRLLNPLAALGWVRGHLRKLSPSGRLPRIEFVGHHLAHAASAAYMAGVRDAAVVTFDGHGDDDCTVLWSYRNGRLTALERHPIPDSIGWFYSAFTALFGFHKNFDEGKLMGLAAYGKPTQRWHDAVARVLYWERDYYRLDMRYIWYGKVDPTTGIAQRMIATFGPPRAGRKATFSQDDKDLAYAVQDAFEDIVLHLARRAVALTGSRNLVVAGGCALNCKANGMAAQLPEIDRLWVQPLSSDAGCSLGAALVIAAEAGDDTARTDPQQTVYWGPSFDDNPNEIEAALLAAGLPYTRSSDITTQAAEALASGKVIGWVQGRMEAGPRALGGRSILADPTHADALDRVNQIKQREPWRPFCPSLLASAAESYLIDAVDAPFMIVAQWARPGVAQIIPSVVHVDGSVRPQYVTEARNARYYGLLQAMEKHTGHPVVLNTSFNVQGEPIVCSPVDAARTFCASGLDAMAIGEYWVTRELP